MNAMVRRRAQTFNSDNFLHTLRVHARVKQRHDAAERMANDIYRKCVDDIGQRRQVQDMFGDAIQCARRPRAVAVPAQIERVDVIIVAQGAGDPIPASRVIETPMHQKHGGFAVRSPIPELQFETVRIKIMGDRFQIDRIEKSRRRFTIFLTGRR
jgi:hypothetical protein